MKMKIQPHIVDGATLLGTSLAIFALGNTFPVNNWNYWIMMISSIIFLSFSLIKFWEN